MTQDVGFPTEDPKMQVGITVFKNAIRQMKWKRIEKDKCGHYIKKKCQADLTGDSHVLVCLALVEELGYCQRHAEPPHANHFFPRVSGMCEVARGGQIKVCL